MTSFAPQFFAERSAEIETWVAQGYVELGAFLDDHHYTLDEMVRAGVMTKRLITPAGMETMDGHDPSAAWQERFVRGRYFTWFFRQQTASAILQLLQSHAAAAESGSQGRAEQ